MQKAEQKFAKAQSNLEACRSRLHELEEGLAQIRQKPAGQPEPSETKIPDQGESYEDSEAVQELHQSSLPPVEGRSDILANNAGSSTTASTSEGEAD